MRPSHTEKGHRRSMSFASGIVGLLPEYLQRLASPSQMDFEYAYSHMVFLLTDPKSVSRTTIVRKQIKNRWARDDPAFLAILLGFMFVCASGWAMCFHESLVQFLKLVLLAVLVDFVALGLIVSTFFWFMCNEFMLSSRNPITVHQKVEWLYAFDVHCNSYFPLFLILYVLQYFLMPFLLSKSFLAALVANTLYAFAFSCYHYITFLGYDALPFLKNTQRFLLPFAPIWIAFVVASAVGFNSSRFVIGLYFS